ncbi:Alkaline phosphodiesterase I [Labilithrix luteola]|uniref:Alkaline phosphodiesterase I n=1 Tax=Labilithrix luteola TaxID=1391654 RepID=A0A0K1PP48_9BACT|nr:ectonucleotide pyrophosphatase/phosphodiesterase [Labilithrix luteola]AKU95293.1 Alkaline phosphodiesterase I [Labilithrix luteola]
MKRWALVFLALFGCTPKNSTAPSTAPGTTTNANANAPNDRSVFVVSVDGLRDDYLRAGSHALPTLRGLVASGTTARSLVSVWPSVTYPAHATLVTGVTPARHGIVNNVVFDPLAKNDGGWFWYARDLRAETLWDSARRAGMDVANVTWPVTVGADIRWNLPQYWRAKNVEDEKLLCQLSSSGLCDELRTAGLEIPGEHRPDRDRALAAAFLLRTKKPRLTFLYLPDLDTVEHEYGPGSPEAWATLEKTDALLGTIIADARASVPNLAVVIVSDHGFAPVEKEVRPNVVLRRAGLLESKGDGVVLGKDAKVVKYRAVTWRAGGSAAIMGEPSAKPEVLSLFTELAAHPETSGIAEVLDGALVEKRGGFPGALVVLQAAAGFVFSERSDEPLVAPSQSRGTHGHAPTHAQMGCTLVMGGDGIRSGAVLGDVAMEDVAPTIASLLGLQLPHATGKPLQAALVER